jgi:hypothetical protein
MKTPSFRGGIVDRPESRLRCPAAQGDDETISDVVLLLGLSRVEHVRCHPELLVQIHLEVFVEILISEDPQAPIGLDEELERPGSRDSKIVEHLPLRLGVLLAKNSHHDGTALPSIDLHHPADAPQRVDAIEVLVEERELYASEIDREQRDQCSRQGQRSPHGARPEQEGSNGWASQDDGARGADRHSSVAT